MPWSTWKQPVQVAFLATSPISIPAMLLTNAVRSVHGLNRSGSRIKKLNKADRPHSRLSTVFGDIVPVSEDALSPTTSEESHEAKRTLVGATKGQPQLSPLQNSMINTLNQLPQMTKHIVFIHPSRNTHGTIGTLNAIPDQNHLLTLLPQSAEICRYKNIIEVLVLSNIGWIISRFEQE